MSGVEDRAYCAGAGIGWAGTEAAVAGVTELPVRFGECSSRRRRKKIKPPPPPAVVWLVQDRHLRYGAREKIVHARRQKDGMEGAMMTIVTHVTLKEGSEPEWDRAMRSRLGSVRGQRGWICTQLLIPNDGMNKRVIIGTWQNEPIGRPGTGIQRSPRRAPLDGLEAAPRQEWWHEVMLDVRASELDGLHGAVDTARDKLASMLTATADWLRATGRGGA